MDTKKLKESIRWDVYEALSRFDGKRVTPELLKEVSDEVKRVVCNHLKRNGFPAEDIEPVSDKLVATVLQRYKEHLSN